MKIFDPRASYTLEMINSIVDNNELSETDITMLNNLIAQTLKHDEKYQIQTEKSLSNMHAALRETFPHLTVKHPCQEDEKLENRSSPRGKR